MSEPVELAITATLERRPIAGNPRRERGTARLHIGMYTVLEIETEWFNKGDPDALIIAAAVESWFAGASQGGKPPSAPPPRHPGQ